MTVKKTFFVILVLICSILSLASCNSNDADYKNQPDSNYDIDDGDTPQNIPPAILEYYIEENPNNHLSCRIFVSTDIATTAEVIVEERGKETWSIGPFETRTMNHDLPILGLHADSVFTFYVTVTEQNDLSSTSGPMYLQTDPLPEDFPPIEITISEPDKMQPGFTIFNIYRWSPRRDNGFGLLIGVDEAGRVVWYHRDDLMIMNTSLTTQGTLVYNKLILGVAEIDLMGDFVNQWNVIQLGIYGIHHEVMELPCGNLMGFSSDLKKIGGYPTTGDRSKTYNVVGDVIVEFNRSGQKVKQWNLFDYLDPHRIKKGFHDSSFWKWPYFWIKYPKDWTHSNAIIYDSTDHSFIVSMRHQDWLAKIDMDEDSLVWKLGDGDDFTLLGDGKWFYHQHAPNFMPNGNIIVYDNGNNRPSYADDPTPYSRVVEYELDYQNMTAEQVWEYRGETTFFASFLGDVTLLDNGNILICDGGLVSNPFEHEMHPDNHKRIRINEVTHDKNPEKVFELVIDDPDFGYSAYSAIRLDSFYF